MPTHFVIFGKTPALSAAELMTVLERDDTNVRFSRVAAAGAVFESPRELGDGFWQSLGGAVKAGRVVGELAAAEAAKLPAWLATDVSSRVPERKVLFGLSPYALEPAAGELVKNLSRAGAAVKQALVAAGRRSRHVTSRERTLSPVTVRLNALTGKGVEYCLLADAAKLTIGVTDWVQDYEEFAEREFGRPRSDSASGMVPVKLARIMLNLSAADPGGILLDPFCGSGTILAEALTLGWRQVVGSDLEAKAVREAVENLQWLEKRYKTPGRFEIFESPVAELGSRLAAGSVSAVVTEPYLGPALRGRETKEELKRIKAELRELYAAAFGTLTKLLRPQAPVVIIFPIFGRERSGVAAELIELVKTQGFIHEHPLAERYSHTPGFDLSESDGLVYARPGQRVRREVVRFRKL